MPQEIDYSTRTVVPSKASTETKDKAKKKFAKQIPNEVLQTLASGITPMGMVPEFEAMQGAYKPFIQTIKEAVASALKPKSFVGHFLDKEGDLYNLGRDFHESVLSQAGLLAPEVEGMSESSFNKNFNDALKKNELIRIRTTPAHTGLQIATDPNNIQLDKLIQYFSQKPYNGISTDFFKGKDYSGGHFTDYEKMISHLLEFFSGK